MSQKLTDEQLDAMLDADEAGNGGNRLELFARIHERRRKRAHAAAKAAQPKLGVVVAPEVMQRLVAAARSPLGPDDGDGGQGAMDYLLLTVQDTLAAGDIEDALFALIRVWRKAWAWNFAHMGPIEGLPTQEQPAAK